MQRYSVSSLYRDLKLSWKEKKERISLGTHEFDDLLEQAAIYTDQLVQQLVHSTNPTSDCREPEPADQLPNENKAKIGTGEPDMSQNSSGAETQEGGKWLAWARHANEVAHFMSAVCCIAIFVTCHLARESLCHSNALQCGSCQWQCCVCAVTFFPTAVRRAERFLSGGELMAAMPTDNLSRHQ